MNRNIVTLKIAGASYGGWTQVGVTRSLEQASAGFTVSVSERFPGQNQPLGVRPGDPCEVLIDNDLVITGYVDRVSPSYDTSSHAISVSGRSKTQDLIDCAVLPPFDPILNQTILEIANRLAEPYGVDIVDALGGETEPIPQVDVNPGEKVFEVISKLAAMKGCLVTDDSRGRLLLTRAGTSKAHSSLQFGRNILTGSLVFDHTQRFKEYRVHGKGSTASEDFGNPSSSISSIALDQGVRRNRVHIVRAESGLDQKRADDRARWEAATRSGRAIAATYTVQGWRQENGELWKVNQLIFVEDPKGTLNGEFLIVQVGFSLSSQGLITTLQIAPKQSYELIPTVPKSVNDLAGVLSDLKGEVPTT